MRITGHLTPPVSVPTNPYHISRAYSAPAAPAPRTPALAPETASAKPEGISRLVASVVPGGVSFEPEAANGRPGATVRTAGVAGGAGGYSMHGRPADRDAAATGVWVGRVIDVNG